MIKLMKLIHKKYKAKWYILFIILTKGKLISNKLYLTTIKNFEYFNY